GLRIGAASDRLYSDRDIFSDEKVTTPSGGSTVLLFQDGIQLQLGHSSEVVLNRSGASQGGALVFAPGLYRFIGGGGTSEVGLELQTPTATVTLGGTELLLSVAEDGTTTVGVISGEVTVLPCGGSSAHISAGQAFKVTRACDGVLSVALASVPRDAATET